MSRNKLASRRCAKLLVGLLGRTFRIAHRRFTTPASAARDEQKRRLDNIQAELGRALSALTEAGASPKNRRTLRKL